MRVPTVSVRLKTIDIGKLSRPNKLDAAPSRRPTGRKRLVAAGLVGLIIIAGLIWHTLNAPNYGQVAKISPDTTPTTKLPEFTSLTTNFYTINYSERYSQAPTDLPPPGVLDQKVLAYQLPAIAGQSRIEIDIKAAPDGGITLDSTYDYYVKHLSQYKLSNAYYHGEAVDIARSTKGSPETAGMWLHGSFLMVVKLTTPDTSQNIDGELKDLLSSVQWRQ